MDHCRALSCTSNVSRCFLGNKASRYPTQSFKRVNCSIWCTTRHHDIRLDPGLEGASRPGVTPGISQGWLNPVESKAIEKNGPQRRIADPVGCGSRGQNNFNTPTGADILVPCRQSSSARQPLVSGVLNRTTDHLRSLTTPSHKRYQRYVRHSSKATPIKQWDTNRAEFL